MDDVFMDRVSCRVLERTIHKAVTIESIPVDPVEKVGHCEQFLIRRHRGTTSTAYIYPISRDCAKNDKPYILHERGRMRHLISKVVRFHALLIVNDTAMQTEPDKGIHHTMIQVRYQEDVTTPSQEVEGTCHWFWELSF
jgi:hypothetical protein